MHCTDVLLEATLPLETEGAQGASVWTSVFMNVTNVSRQLCLQIKAQLAQEALE